MKVKQNETCEVCVIGGGFMGAAVALGLVEAGVDVLMVDKVSKIHKASRANFGLVWSQSKGGGNRPYAHFSEQAARMFAQFTKKLEVETGIDVELRLGTGVVVSVGEHEFRTRKETVERMHREAEADGARHPSRILDRKELQDLIGNAPLGEEVMGGSLSEIDGDVNPLLLLKAMRNLFQKSGGRFSQGLEVESVDRAGIGYRVKTSGGEIKTEKVVLAAGLGNIKLAEKLGVNSHLKPQKGQLLVTEKIIPFLSFPFGGLRQTGHGSVMIGATQENTGYDVSTTMPKLVHLAKRAVQTFPHLKHIKVVRSWGSLRVLTEDGLPLYDHLSEFDLPNVYLLGTHSCVTLTSLHSTLFPRWILGGQRPKEIESFNLERFNVTT